MALEEYTDSDEVRAALGVSDDELKDAVIELPLYENALTKEAAEIGTDCMADYRTVDAIEETDRTTVQQDFHMAFSLFSTFAVARKMTVSLPLFSPKTIGDGKAAATRYSDSPYKETIKAVLDSYEEYRNYLLEKYGVYGGGRAPAAVAPIALVGAASPDYDPVTGEGAT